MEKQGRKDLLEAIKEFDRLSDPLDLTSVLVDAHEAAKMREALRAGRKLSRIARAAVIPPGPSDAELVAVAQACAFGAPLLPEEER